MRRSIKRAAVAAVLAMLFAGFSAASGTPTASGQTAPEGPPPIHPSGATIESYSARGITVSPSSPGTGDESAVTPTTGGTEGAPAGGGESVSLPDGRVQLTNAQSQAYPHRAIGQIELTQANGPNPGDFICTGWLIDSNTILSAGHCAYDPDGNQGNIIEAATFFPGRYRTPGGTVVNPFGSCNVLTADSPFEWRHNGSEYADYSIMNLDCNVGNTVGWLGFFYVTNNANPNALAGLPVRVEGYPGDKPFGSGWYMGGTIFQSQKKMIFYKMDTFGGQSGSPVFQFNRPGCGPGGAPGPCGAGIHAYGYPDGGGGPHQNSNHGPRFTAARFNFIQSIAALNGP